MSDYPNVLKNSLEKDDDFNNEVQNAVLTLFKKEKTSVLKNKNFEAKIINGNKSNRYLIVNNLKTKVISVYYEDISEWNEKEPFKYNLQSLSKNEKIYSHKVLSFKNNKGKKEDSNSHPLAKMLKKLGPDAFKELGMSIDEALEFLSSARSMNGDEPYSVGYSAYELNQFCKFLGVKRDTDFWVKNSEKLNEILQIKVGDIMISIDYMFKIAEKQGFNSDNRFEFNDLDNHMWKVEKGIALDSQNFGFYCLKNNQDLTIYAWDRGNNNTKKHSNLEDLLVDIENNNIDIVDDIALKIIDGKVTFVDNAIIYSLELNIKATKNALIDEDYGDVEYPVDIYSFKYQLAYYQKHYRYDEFKFMNQALLTLGSGFSYDAKNGRFYDDNVEYDPSVGNYEEKIRTERVESIYGEPKGFSKLDEDWAAAVERMLNTLKVDRPLPIVRDNAKEKNEKLDEIIQFYEESLANMKIVKPTSKSKNKI
jgi:hypothetical protein